MDARCADTRRPQKEVRMEAIQSRARLANGASARQTARPAVPISRADAEEALRASDGGPVELRFDVVRGADDAAARTFSLQWDPVDLEELLESAKGDEFALVFDAAELERAIDEPDVEAQGIREKAAVLTVAVAAMAGTAGSASAYGYASAGPAQAAGASGSGYVVPAGASEALVDQSSVGASGTGYVVPAGESAALVDDAAAAGASGTGYVVPAGESEALVNDAEAAGASGTGYVVPAGQSTAIVNQEPAAASAGGRTLSTAGAAGIGTGIALLITGAGFVAVRGKRRPDDAGLSPA
jgi:hypothetical protein